MKEESTAEKEKNINIRSSITVSSTTVCEDEACIGKIVDPPSPDKHRPEKVPPKKNASSGTVISVGGKEACTDEACIGKS